MPTSTYRDKPLPPDDLDWAALVPLIGAANAAVARYDGVLVGAPNPDMLLAPLTMQEAVFSSLIEGIHTTLSSALEYEAAGKLDDESTPEKADHREVLNYRAALREGAELLGKLPLSQRLVLQLHGTLMQGVRGRNKAPGRYRTVPNWIGRPGCSIDDAQFVPCGADRVPDAMSRWEAYLNSDAPDALVQLAIVHVEFEAIHPFLDGNGRLGRLIMPLFLKEKGLLTRPNLYLSGYLEANRPEYYERLLAVSRDGDWTGWCAFFLKGVIAQARESQTRAEAIFDLYERRKRWIVEATHSEYAVQALDWFFANPVFQTTDFVSTIGIPRRTALRLLGIVREKGLLMEWIPGGGRRASVLLFPELLNTAEGTDIF